MAWVCLHHLVSAWRSQLNAAILNLSPCGTGCSHQWAVGVRTISWVRFKVRVWKLEKACHGRCAELCRAYFDTLFLTSSVWLPFSLVVWIAQKASGLHRESHSSLLFEKVLAIGAAEQRGHHFFKRWVHIVMVVCAGGWQAWSGPYWLSASPLPGAYIVGLSIRWLHLTVNLVTGLWKEEGWAAWNLLNLRSKKSEDVRTMIIRN